jgi:hypothetical protein
MILAIFHTLMYTFSLTLHKTVFINVHNRCSDVRLVSPVCFFNRGFHYRYPIKETWTGVMMKIGFNFDLDQDTPRGVLMYKVRRKGNTGFDHQSGVDNTSTRVTKEVLKMMRLLVIFKFVHSEKLKVNTILVEYDNKHVLNEDKLAQLYEKANDVYFGHDFSSWLMYDNTVLNIAHKVVQKISPNLEIAIARGIRYLNVIKPIWYCQR